MTSEEVDKLTEKVRASQLAVNDLAIFNPTDFCMEEDKLFLPSNASPRVSSETYDFTLRVKVLPEKKFEATLVEPTKAGEFGLKDLADLVSELSNPGGFFEPASCSCDEVARTSRWPLKCYEVTTIDGHASLSALAKDLASREYIFDDE